VHVLTGRKNGGIWISNGWQLYSGPARNTKFWEVFIELRHKKD